MTTPVKTIDKSGVEDVIKKMLNHSDRYANTSMFIWNASYLDGIQQELVIKPCIEVNKDRSRNDWRYFKLITIRNENQHFDIACSDNRRRIGYILTPKTTLPPNVTPILPVEVYLHKINRFITEIDNSLPTIVYLPYDNKSIEFHSKSCDVEQYVFDDYADNKRIFS